jgi:hypothetical protein
VGDRRGKPSRLLTRSFRRLELVGAMSGIAIIGIGLRLALAGRKD